MIVDNFDIIKDIITFNNKDEFYFIQIVQRKKDGNNNQVGSNGYRTIKTYYIFSLEQFLKKRDKIIELCITNNARAYMHINVRNAKEVSLECVKRYAGLVLENNCFQGCRVWDSVCGGYHALGYKALWLVDLDSKDSEYVNKIKDIINSCRGVQEYKIKYEIPTLNGIHLMTIGFDLNQFYQKLALENLDNIDIHKDSPTLLYFKA